MSELTGGCGGRVRFGVFEADLRASELRKFGILIKLQHQPFRLLAILLERPGQIVTREELRQGIWAPGTTVDFDHGLGTALNKVREVLGDSADSPRYIETLARRGYRFIAPVEVLDAPRSAATNHTGAIADEAPPQRPEAPRRVRTGARKSPFSWVLTAAILATALALGSLVWSSWVRPAASPAVRFTQVSWANVNPGSISSGRFPVVLTDGVRIYFTQFRNGQVVLANAPVAGGDTHLLMTPAEVTWPSLADISPDGSKLLVRSDWWAEMAPLWIIPSAGGSARKALRGLVRDAAWLPDGESILYSSGRDLWIMQNDGREPRKLATLPGSAFWLRYSPDGTRLRFTVLDPTTRSTSLWELSSDGKELRPLLPAGSNPPAECCGNWTADGTYFVFQSTLDKTSNVWALRETGRIGQPSPQPVQITAGPLQYLAPVPARQGDRIFVVGTQGRSQLSRFDSKSRRFVHYLPELTSAGRTEFSGDGTRVAWLSTSDGSLWQSRLDGTQRVQLSSHPMRIHMMRWSPDARRIAFMGKEPGKPWTIYMVSADGGESEMLLSEPGSEADPGWSLDGNSIVFGYTNEGESPVEKAIRILNLKTGAISTVPGSTGLFSPRWSPDGRYLAAMPLDRHKLMLFDRTTEHWTELATEGVNNPVWSSNGRYIYFHAFKQEGQPIYRISISERRMERIVDFLDLESADAVDYWGLTPDNAPLVSFHFLSANIYAMEWEPACC